MRGKGKGHGMEITDLRLALERILPAVTISTLLCGRLMMDATTLTSKAL